MRTIDIEECIERCKHSQGINVHALKPGTTVYVITKNSMYKITKGSSDGYDVTIQGGKRFLKPMRGNFSGSTFGGSMLKVGWIGHMMHMEIYIHETRKSYRTTEVRAARVVGNGWSYDLEWN